MSDKLLQAIVGNKFNKVIELLNNGCDVNYKNKHGNTGLHFASVYGYIDIVKLLLYHRADPRMKDDNGERSFDKAYHYGHMHICELLRQAVRRTTYR